MGMSFRLSVTAWQMLQRLSQQTAILQFCSDDGQFYFELRGHRVDIVRQRTVDALTKAGMVRRQRERIPSYVINEKGLSALRLRMPAADLMDESEPVNLQFTVVSQEQAV